MEDLELKPTLIPLSEKCGYSCHFRHPQYAYIFVILGIHNRQIFHIISHNFYIIMTYTFLEL